MRRRHPASTPGPQPQRPRHGHPGWSTAPKVGTLGTIDRSLLVRLWCRSCGRSVEFPAEQLRTCLGPDLPVEEFRRRSTCSRCGERNAGLQVVPDTGTVAPITTVTMKPPDKSPP